MLPDLISATSLKVGPLERWPVGAADGIRCHRRADEAFHADRRFVGGMTAMRDDLMDAGFGRGPARAAAHVSWELLLDGTLLGDRATVGAYLDALAVPGPTWAPAAEVGELDRWQEVVRRYRERGLPDGIAPASTADLVVRLLARRPRLAVDASLTSALVEVLVQHEPRVVEVAGEVITATAAA